MRTTLELEESVLRDVLEIQRREGGTLGEVVSRLLAEALARRKRPAAPAFEWTSQPMALVELADKDAVRDRFAE